MDYVRAINKICIITSIHPPFDTRIFHKEAKSLVKAGFEVHYIAPHNVTEIIEGIHIIPLNRSKKRIIRVFKLPNILMKAMKTRAASFHLHDPELIVIGLILKWIFGKKVIYDVHENYFDAIMSGEKHWIPAFLKKGVSLSFDRFEKIATRCFDAIIPAAPDIAQHFTHRQLVTICNYPFKQKLPIRKMEKKQQCIINYIGSITEIRGIAELIEAFGLLKQKHANVTFQLGGNFHDSAFETRIHALPAFKKVDFLGYVQPYDKVLDYLKKADIGVICYQQDPNAATAVHRSNKLFEYLSMGIPVIVSDLPQWKDFVENNQCGLAISLDDPEQIGQRLSVWIENPKKRKLAGIRGYRLVLKKYNWQNESRKLISLYENLISCKTATGNTIG